MQVSPTWPRALFFLTVGAALTSTALTMTYLAYSARIERQEKELEERRAEYEARIAELQQALVVDQVVSDTIRTPVKSKDCRKLGILGQRICIPVQTVELREITRTVRVENPEIKAQLDKAYAQLQSLSAAAVKSDRKVADLRPYVELARTLMAPGISVLVLVASLHVILSRKYAADSEKWAFGSVGTVLGFWLK
jgi:hypothetical protein